MIEQNTNYAYKLKYMDNPTFDKVRELSTKFYRELPQALQDELFEALNRGIDILDSEPQMTAYLFAFGKMHQAKLDYAFGKLPEEFFEQPEINIIDYGCGQALGTMCYADFLREKGYSQKVKTISLIEPSEICLKRSALHAAAFFPDAEIKTVNKKFDELTQDDIVCSEETPTLHILSNVLDVLNFDLDKFSILIKDSLKGYNQFVCVGPYFNYSVKDERMKKFFSIIQGKESYFKTIDKNEFVKVKDWTAQLLCFSKGEGGITMNQKDLKFIGEYDIDTYMHMFNTTTFDFVKNPKNPSSLFFSCGHLPNGKRNYGVIGPKALERIKVDGFTNDNKKVFLIRVYEIRNIEGELVTMPILLLNNNVNVVARFLNIESEEEELSTKVTDKDIENGVKDEFGVIYSHDRKRLLRCENEEIISYVINEGTIVICDNAFYECKSLRQVHISDSVRCIGNYSFWNCKSLRQITIPQSVTSIGEEAFWRCSSLQQVTMSNSVTYIGVYAFALCSSLQQIIIPESVTTIGDGTFHGCESLQQIFIPNTVKSIGEYAFSECESLKQIILPELITKIKYKTFYCCYSLQHINIPNSVTSIEANAFYGCAMIQLNIPNSVIRIGKAAFSNCRSIQQINIPELVTEICDETFSECTSLQQVIIPNSVTRIGKDAFSYCLSLKQITIPNSVTSIAESTFDECSSLKQVTIPNSITCIRKFAFCGCNSLQQFIIPETVTTIEGGVFNNCYGINLTSKTSRYIVQDKLLIDKFENKIISCFGNEKVVIIPESVTSIGKWAFIYCDSIQQVVIPDSVSIIGESAFHGCDSLKQVIIPKGSKQRFLDIIQENLRDKLVEE
ncbi:MAG: hypothetical protein F083_954 [bacterium F083]|nr:MAG: hypothetical protein F083_954 [bacterium F083]